MTMNIEQEVTTVERERLVDHLFKLGEVAVRFARVERAPRLPDGRRETDVEHSFLLSLSAVEIADQFFPELDKGLIAQFSLVHDLPEVYTGDVWTFDISDEERQRKEVAEALATERLLQELPPYLADLLRRYEEQIEPEARFVRFVDKVMPAIINTLAGDRATFMDDHGVYSAEELRKHRAKHNERLQKMFPEFPIMHQLRQMISERMEHHYFPPAVIQSQT